MTDRKPDFYRVRFGEHLWATGDYRTHSNCVGYAKVFMRETEAQDFVTTTGGRIVPVYVKVTRKPKLHDFAWALRRMREGKAIIARLEAADALAEWVKTIATGNVWNSVETARYALAAYEKAKGA